MGSVLSKKKSKYAVKQAASLTTANSNSSSLTESKSHIDKQKLKLQRPSSMPPNTLQALTLEKYNTSRSTLSTAPTSVINNSLPNSSALTHQKNSYSETQRYNDEAISSFVHQSQSFYLPDDWDSKEYQYNLHFALKSLFGGNVTPAIVPALKKGSRVIQMGICSGPWIMDMATHYPDCHFTGVQLAAEMMQNVPALQNVTFKDGDVLTQGIPCNDSSIDYIHLRCAGAIVSLEKWPKLFSEINRVLKPEGVVRIEELDHSPTGTLMIESFMETLKAIVVGMNQDVDIASKYGNMLQSQGFQVIESKKKRVHYASDGKLSQEFVGSILNGYATKAEFIAPKLGLDQEDYRHRIEMIFAECVRVNAHMDWYSWVGRKALSSHSAMST